MILVNNELAFIFIRYNLLISYLHSNMFTNKSFPFIPIAAMNICRKSI